MIIYYICCYWGLNLTKVKCVIKLGRFKFWLIVNSYNDKNFNDEFYIGLITNYKGDLWYVGYVEDFDAVEVRVYNFIIH